MFKIGKLGVFENLDLEYLQNYQATDRHVIPTFAGEFLTIAHE